MRVRSLVPLLSGLKRRKFASGGHLPKQKHDPDQVLVELSPGASYFLGKDGQVVALEFLDERALQRLLSQQPPSRRERRRRVRRGKRLHRRIQDLLQQSR